MDVKSKRKNLAYQQKKPTPRPKKKMFTKKGQVRIQCEFGTGKAKTKLSAGGATDVKIR